MDANLEQNIKDIKQALAKHKVIKAYVFGSASNSDKKPKDYDFLVVFSDDIPLLEYADIFLNLKIGLEEILEAKVDLLTEKSLKNPVLKEEIYRTRIPIYEAA